MRLSNIHHLYIDVGELYPLWNNSQINLEIIQCFSENTY